MGTLKKRIGECGSAKEEKSNVVEMQYHCGDLVLQSSRTLQNLIIATLINISNFAIISLRQVNFQLCDWSRLFVTSG